MKSEYDFTNGFRGKYAKKFSQGSNLIILAPDISKFFKDSEAVNEALRSLIKLANENVMKDVHNKKRELTPQKRRRSA